MDDEQLIAICEAEISDIDSESDLSDERTKNLDFYHGDLSTYLPAPKDRSSVATRDSLDTVESVLPSLIKIFLDSENAVEFIPQNPMDEDQSRLETKAVRNIFFEQNEGFLVLYSFIKDALISNTGILKCWWEEGTWEREEYENLLPEEADKLLNSGPYEVVSYEETETGSNLIIKCKKTGKVRIEVIPPEEFGISRNANSPNPKKAGFTFHRSPKTVSYLVEQGFDRDVVENIPSDDNWDEERLARRNRSDEQDFEVSTHKSMRTVWVTECYVNVDLDDDGIAELVKVTLGSMGAGSKLLAKEEVDCNPFVTITPVILTHKFYGYSLVDLVRDINEIRTVLFRGILDNMYLANNVRMGANERVNLDDLLVSRPGGVVRTKGTDSPGNHISPIVHPSIPPESFGLLEVLDDMIKSRTGIGDEVAGLDSQALANINTGVIMQAYDAARMRIELMARIIAELGLKELFKDIHRLLHKNHDRSIQMQINNQWVDIDPAHWRDDRTPRVTVGLGHANRDKKLMSITEILTLQEKAAMSGYQYVTPDNIHNAISDKIEAMGMHVERYFQDPKTYQPPETPDPQAEMQQAMMQMEMQKINLEREKVQIESQVKMMLAQSKEREMMSKREIDQVNNSVKLERARIDEQNQIMRAITDKNRQEFQESIGARKQEWLEAKEQIELQIAHQANEIEEYKAKLNSATSLEEKIMDVEQKTTAEAMKHIQAMAVMLRDAETERREQKGKILDWIKQNGSDRIKGLAETL